MRVQKTMILQIIGLLTLIFFNVLSYYNNQIFLDKLLTCSLILGMLLIFKMLNESRKTQPVSNRSYPKGSLKF